MPRITELGLSAAVLKGCALEPEILIRTFCSGQPISFPYLSPLFFCFLIQSYTVPDALN